MTLTPVTFYLDFIILLNVLVCKLVWLGLAVALNLRTIQNFWLSLSNPESNLPIRCAKNYFGFPNQLLLDSCQLGNLTTLNLSNFQTAETSGCWVMFWQTLAVAPESSNLPTIQPSNPPHQMCCEWRLGKLLQLSNQAGSARARPNGYFGLFGKPTPLPVVSGCEGGE